MSDRGPVDHYVSYVAAQPGTERAWRCQWCSGIWSRWADISGSCPAPRGQDVPPESGRDVGGVMLRLVGPSLAEEFEPGGRYGEGGEFEAVGAQFRWLTTEIARLSAVGVPAAALRELELAKKAVLDFIVRDDSLRPRRYVLTGDEDLG